MIAAQIAVLAGLSGCDKQAKAPEIDAPSETTGDIAMPAEMKIGKGIGTVTAIDMVSGKITLDHGPVTELQWRAMKMGFEATPEILKDIDIGDKVAFEFQWNGKTGKLTKVEER